jgi:hypothetical protein
MANEKKQLQEGINNIHIEGIVKDIRIDEKPINGQDAISGEVDIQVTPESIHTLNVFSYKLNQKKEVSGLFKTLVTIRDDYKTIDVHGIESADKVRVETSGSFDNGKVGKNEYASPDGEWKSYPRLTAKFINRIKSGEVFEPQAKFTLEIAVSSMKEEMRNGEETGRLILKGYIVNYQEQKDDTKKIYPFDFVVQNPVSVSYVQDNYEKGQTVKIFGDIVNTKVVTEKLVEVGFGEPQKEYDRKEVREYIIVGGTPPYDEDDKNAYDVGLIREAVKKRDAAIEKKKEEKKSNTSSQNGGTGFGKPDPFANSDAKKDPFVDPFNTGKPIDISDDDLPF